MNWITQLITQQKLLIQEQMPLLPQYTVYRNNRPTVHCIRLTDTFKHIIVILSNNTKAIHNKEYNECPPHLINAATLPHKIKHLLCYCTIMGINFFVKSGDLDQDQDKSG